MPEKQNHSLAVDPAGRWRALEQTFAAEGYSGGRPEPLPGGSGEPAPGIIEVAGTTRPGLIVTAPHATNHERSGRVKWADRGTGGLALLLAEITGCGALIAVGGLAKTPGDANFDPRHPLKDRLAELAPDVVVDLHGMRTRDGMDVDLGFGEGAVPEKFVASLDDAGLRFTRNALFDAMRPTTVAASAQVRGIPAVQVEIGAHLRPPEAEATDMSLLVDTLVRAIKAEVPETAGTAVPGDPARSGPSTTPWRLSPQLVPIPSGVPTVVVRPEILPQTTGPVPVTVRAGDRTAVAWAWTSEAAGMPDRVRDLPPGQAGVTRRLVAALTDGPGLAHRSGAIDDVDVVVPPLRRHRIVAALADDLPGRHEVHVSPQDVPGTGSYLLVRDGVTAWVTAVPRDHVRPGTVRLDYQHRLLTMSGARTEEMSDAEHVVLIAAPRAMIETGTTLPWPRRAATALDRGLERLWRRLFGAPEFSARVVQAHAGDDATPIVSLNPAAFDRLGIDPGQQVMVRWGGREAAAQAVEDHDPPSSGGVAAVSKAAQRVNRLWPDPPEDLSPHVVVRMSAHLRGQLEAPTSTVVTIRRRLRTFLMANLNRLVIPVAGLGLAIHQINDPRWPVIGTAAVLMTFFALARLRIPKPRSGAHVDKGWVNTMAGSADATPVARNPVRSPRSRARRPRLR
ncbi:hypothetical protein [Myceligenerans xiligouense]|uniref:Uncharacterized protein n=1 Tax=Myceligenerans xiligouense TaxID=253184 RepID=A0A3N4ZMM9_9MICO|nr:hypothetical protein [Myceligenerans xiligouense]RPF22175.1 hypothetical protein EDD34_2823 [Myceligenerans xiligouense]